MGSVLLSSQLFSVQNGADVVVGRSRGEEEVQEHGDWVYCSFK